MDAALPVTATVAIPEGELEWTLPPDPGTGRADPALGGFTTSLRLDTAACTVLDPGQRRRITDRVPAFHRDGCAVVTNTEGAVTVKVDWGPAPCEAVHMARERLASVLARALEP
ncbi:hypothetical protein O4J56_03835 [Nocardiopsis sp. RSe5-2]|uniref:Uncharacterized protein n=1 Tax=Nocardiopsis endophytica TaxID=3018445 RepID=A0ABT4TYI9_9ACTN|nr:hypothetical protein [Nocardiopsis endophytica]MDA2809761.1 hypothetical protein [Nocardiopsis endophytica]